MNVVVVLEKTVYEITLVITVNGMMADVIVDEAVEEVVEVPEPEKKESDNKTNDIQEIKQAPQFVKQMEVLDDASWCIDQATCLLKSAATTADKQFPERVSTFFRHVFQVIWTSNTGFVDSSGKTSHVHKWLALKKLGVKDLALSTKSFLLERQAAAVAANEDSAKVKLDEQRAIMDALPAVNLLAFKSFIQENVCSGGSVAISALSLRPTYRRAVDGLPVHSIAEF